MPSAQSRRVLITGAAASSAALSTVAAAGADRLGHTPVPASWAEANLVALACDAALTPPQRRQTARLAAEGC
ncbi:hypothetical protein [Pseudofrankia sp. DC12]|uniref:hypothetical protein n=1 Tax=Pseudofrankia sp. DC12 TaxID=683315 RepID=UPI0005F8557B|nr:hypothetical protein [Pseudofrankia sp. DC12]